MPVYSLAPRIRRVSRHGWPRFLECTAPAHRTLKTRWVCCEAQSSRTIQSCYAEHSHLYGSRGDVPDDYYEIPLGEARIDRAGEDITLVSYGYGVHILRETAQILDESGVDAEIIDLRSLHPVDYDMIVASIQKTGRAVMLDTSRRTGGIMSEVVAEVQERAMDWLDGPVMRVGSKDVPWPYNRGLEQDILPKAKEVVEAARKIIAF